MAFRTPVVFIIVSFLLCVASAAQAQELKASLAQMPVYSETKDKGVLVDMVKAIAEASGRPISIVVVPFARSMDNVIAKKVDFHAPLIKNPNLDDKTLKYDHSTATIFHVNFTLYTNKNKPVAKADLAKAKVETDAAHTQYFPFPTIASSDLEASLKKLDAGRIDAFIFADMASDPLVEKLKLTNIARALYQTFDVKIILPKGGQNGPTDKLLSEAIDKLKASGKWEKIMGIIDQPFKDKQFVF